MTRTHNMNLYFKDPYEMTHFSILLSVAMLFDLFQHFVNNDTIFFCFIEEALLTNGYYLF